MLNGSIIGADDASSESHSSDESDDEDFKPLCQVGISKMWH